MTRLAVVFIIFFSVGFAAPAFAGAEDAEQFGTEAGRLKNLAVAAQMDADQSPALPAPDLAADLVQDLERFGLAASRLSRQIKSENGPADFGCIFLGMAEETDLQLQLIDRAQTGGDQSDALIRLISMLADAEDLGPAAASALRRGAQSQAAYSCPADLIAGVDLTSDPNALRLSTH